jgi:hypothetical protein
MWTRKGRYYTFLNDSGELLPECNGAVPSGDALAGSRTENAINSINMRGDGLTWTIPRLFEAGLVVGRPVRLE